MGSIHRCSIAFASSNLRPGRKTAELDSDPSIAAVAFSVRRVVTQAVLRTDLRGDTLERVSCVGEIPGRKNLTARFPRQRVELDVGYLVKLLADRELLELSKLTEIYRLLDVRLRTKASILTSHLSG